MTYEWRRNIKLLLRNSNVIAGLVLLSFIIALCILAFVKYGWVLGKWCDYTFWETYYPRGAAPSWISIFTGKTYMPYMNKYISCNRSNICIFTINYTYDEPPQDIDFIVYKTAGLGNITLYVVLPNGTKIPVDNSITTSSETSLSIASGKYLVEMFNMLPGSLVTFKLFKIGGRGVYKFIVVSKGVKIIGMRVIVKSQVFGLLGTDIYGRDLWAGLVWGAPISLMVGFVAALVSTAIAVILGILSGYYGFFSRIFNIFSLYFISEALVWTYDVIINFPALILLILISIAYGKPSPFEVALILGLLGWGGTARVVHVIAQQTAATPFVEAERSIGVSDLRIMFKHVLPHAMPYVLIRTILSIPAAIITEAVLSFLGLSSPFYPTWGRMLEAAEPYLQCGYWWWWVPPGLMLAIICLAFVLIGRGLEEVLNPRLRHYR